MKTTSLIFAVIMVLGGNSPVRADVIEFRDASLWSGAVAGSTLINDTFSNDIASAPSITFDSGVVSANSGGVFCCGDNGVSAGEYRNALGEPGSTASLLNTWIFPEPIFALAFSIRGAAQNGLEIVLDGESFRIENSTGQVPEFFGYTSTSAISDVSFRNPGRTVLFHIDEITFASAPVSSVPLPGLHWLV
ncbi:MAG: hypothetical protein R3228_06685, partial [Halioglobus sp.]|nr:hypothetical protein [Halioglobus sp.]